MSLLAISQIVDVAQAAKKVIGDDAVGQTKKMYGLMRNAESIAQKARKNVMMYPTIISEGILSSSDLLPQLLKHIEVEYAIFTIIVSGLGSVLASGDEEMISRISTESMVDESIIKSMIEDIKPRISFEAVNQSFVNSIFEDDDDDDMVNHKTVGGESDLSDFKREILNLNPSEVRSWIDGKVKREGLSGEDAMALMEHYEKHGAHPSKDPTLYKDFDKLSKTAPLIVKIPIILPNTHKEIEFPVIIKANPHLVSTREAMLIVERAHEMKNIPRRLIKLTTGEIRFFRDFIMQEDKAQQDRELYEKSGTHPWYRQLMKRKGASRAKRLIRDGFDKKELTNKGDIPPTTTLVLTKDELERATKIPYSKIIRDKKYLERIMHHLMLIAIVVWNPQTEMFSFHYMGYDEPTMISGRQMQSPKDINNTLAESVNRLSLKV